ncbi:MAG: hypothetical protein AB1700_02570 [Bacillota bacterium]
MNPQRLLAIGGMILVLTGLVYGAVYSAAFLSPLRSRPPALEKEALQAIDKLAPEEALQKWDRRTRLLSVREFNRGAHTHFTLMGLTAIVFVPYLGKTGFGTGVKYLLAAGTLLGALVLPSGVAAEIWNMRLGRSLALVGGALFLLSLLVITLGYISGGNRSQGE